MRANGYGSDIEVTEDAVVIYSGKVAAKIQGTDRITIPLADVASVEYRPASMLVNGSMRIVPRIADPALIQSQYMAYGADPVNRVNPQSLVVQWRRKDEPSFAAIRQAIESR